MKFKDAQTYAIHKFDTDEFLNDIKEEDDTMLNHLPLLKKMNEKGFITHNSQAGSKTKGISVINNKPYLTEERAFIEGFMSYKQAVLFLKNMNLYTDKNAVNVYISDNPKFLNSELDVPLTITTQNNETKVETHMPLYLPINTINLFKKEHKINRNEDVLYVICWDPIWNRDASKKDGLFTDVFKHI
uniref:Uncharacterized protein n=1 Tax=viral metagenome TaxID=1070528 RepID=A0A6C0JJ36_9ZZZZ